MRLARWLLNWLGESLASESSSLRRGCGLRGHRRRSWGRLSIDDAAARLPGWPRRPRPGVPTRSSALPSRFISTFTVVARNEGKGLPAAVRIVSFSSSANTGGSSKVTTQCNWVASFWQISLSGFGPSPTRCRVVSAWQAAPKMTSAKI